MKEFKGLEERGPFRHRTLEPNNQALNVIISLANRWRKKPDSEGKRLVGKILSLYDAKDALLEIVLLNDNPPEFEKHYSQFNHRSRLFWLEVSCLCGRQELVNYFVNTLGGDVAQSTNLLAYGLSTGDALFAYRLTAMLKEKGYMHQDCLNLYNKCDLKDLANIKSLINSKDSIETNVPSKGLY